MFAGTALAERIEAAERRLMADIARSAAARRPGCGALALEVAGGIATWVDEGSPANKVTGLGFAGPLDLPALEAVEAAFDERGAPVQVELSCLADPSVAEALSRRGYALVNFENVLGRPLPAELPPSPPQVEVAESGASERASWLRVVATGFAHPDLQGVPSPESYPLDLVERTLDDMACVAGVRQYLARRGGVLAGAASMRLSDGVCQLCGASTLPEHRRRGVQTALTTARLHAAAAAGCDLAVVTTQPGSKSQENAQRHGFALLYTRAVLVRPTPPAPG